MNPTGLNRRTLLAASLALGGCAAGLNAPLQRGQHAQSLVVVTDDGQRTTQRFWLTLPAGYLAGDAAWPLVFFLHGSGERGSDLQRVKVHGPPKLVDQGRDFPFILVAPQLGEGRSWDPRELHALSLLLQRRLRVDATRVSATGLSLGGHGVWHWASAYPDGLAAIAPVCGYGQPEQACAMRRVPVRAYHGEVDNVVPLARQSAMVDAVRACGGRASLTIYPGVGHDAWNLAYADAGLYLWLMAQHLA